MSAISTFITKIRTAIYGEEVRGAIADAIEQCYGDVSNPSLNTAAFATAIASAYDGGILDIQEKSTVAGMTNTAIIYRYVGTETGMKPNHLYYHNGTAWIPIGDDVETDTQLTQSGVPADAKATGDAISAINAGLTEEEKQTIFDLFKAAAYTSSSAAANVTKLQILWDLIDEGNASEILDGVTFVSGKTISTVDGSVVTGTASTYVTSEITVLSLVKSGIKAIFGAASSEHRIAFYDSNHNTILVHRINSSSNESLLAVVPQNAAYMRFAGVLTDSTINVKYFPARTNLVTSETMLPSGQYINPSNGAIAYGSNDAAKVDVDASTEYTLANIASGAIYSGDTFSTTIAYQAEHSERTITTSSGQTKVGVNKVSTELLPMGVFKTSELATIGTLTVEV